MRQYAQSSQFSTWDRIRGCTASVDRSISSQRSRRLSCVHSLDPWQRSWISSCSLVIWETHLTCRHRVYSELIKPWIILHMGYIILAFMFSQIRFLLEHPRPVTFPSDNSRQYHQFFLRVFYPCRRLHSKTGSRQIHHKTYNYLPLCQCNRRDLLLKYDLDICLYDQFKLACSWYGWMYVYYIFTRGTS